MTLKIPSYTMYAIFMKSEMTIQNLPLLFLSQIFIPHSEGKYIVRSFALHLYESFLSTYLLCLAGFIKRVTKALFTI